MTSKEPTSASPARHFLQGLWRQMRRFLIVAVSAVPLTPVRIARAKKRDVDPESPEEDPDLPFLPSPRHAQPASGQPDVITLRHYLRGH
jgi:hypothetical protein